jgi:hypothetical protein
VNLLSWDTVMRRFGCQHFLYCERTDDDCLKS